MNYQAKLKHNIILFYFFNILTGLLFPIPIWVAFEHRILSFEQMAVFSAVSTAIETFFQIPTGALADLLGRKLALCTGWTLLAGSYFWEAIATTPTMFFWVFALGGLATALSSGADTALVYDSLKELHREDDFPEIISKAKFWYRMSMAIATILGGALFAINIRLPYILLSLAFLIAVIVILFFQETTILPEPFRTSTYLSHMRQGFGEIFKSRPMTMFTFYYIVIGGITWSCLNYYNLTFMTDVGFSTNQLTIFFALAYIISAFTIYYLAKSKRLLTRERVYLGFPLLMSVSLLPGIVANHFTAPFMLIITQVTGGSRFTFLDRYANQEFASKYRATALSALSMMVSICYISFLFIGGQFQDRHGTKIIYTALGIITVLIVLPIAFRLSQHHKNLHNDKSIPLTVAMEEEREEHEQHI